MTSPGLAADLLAMLQSHLGGWQSAARLFRLHTKLGSEALLVERVEGIEQIIGAPLPPTAQSLLPNRRNVPPGALASQQADVPQIMLGHTPLAPALAINADHTDTALLCGYRFEVTVLSANSGLDLADLLGSAALLEWQTASSRDTLRPLHGHISAAESLGSNGGLARYRLVIEPWLSFLRYRQDSWVFQHQTVAEVLNTIFSDYQDSGALVPAWRLALADRYPQRSLLTQYRETDWHFVSRLIASEGLVCWFEHTGDPDSTTLGRHTLVISDRLGFDAACQANPESPLRYHRASSTEQRGDSFQGWREQRAQQIARVRLSSYDDRTLSNQTVEASLPNRTERGPATALLDHVGHYAWAGEIDGQRRADNLLASYQVTACHVAAEGTVRSLAPGQTFELSQHHQYGAEAQFRVLSVWHQGRNNLQADFKAALHRAFPHRMEDNSFTDFYRNQAIALHAGAALPSGPLLDTPFAPPLLSGRFADKPTILGVQTATVVGQDGAAIDTDRNHRVKVQFHWQRGNAAHNRQAHISGDDNAPANEQAWAWVRVAASQAGANWGSVLIPRVGQEVLVGFLAGDIDRPVILGATYNGQGNDDAQHNQHAGRDGAITGNAPSWFAGKAAEHAHPDALSGIKTQAISQSQAGASDKQTGGYSQLVFDDHPDSTRLELGTTQAHSWLQMGHVRHQADNARREARQHGLQLETQGHGALRAALGLLISSHARPDASGGQLDSDEASQILQQQRDRHLALMARANQHLAQTDREPVEPAKHSLSLQLQSLQSSLAATTNQAPAWQRPELIQSGPAGVAWLTPRQLSLNASGHLAWIARDQHVAAHGTLSINAPAGIRLFAGGTKPDAGQPEQSRDLRLIAASGNAIVQAQKDQANLNALKAVNISSQQSTTLASPTNLKLIAQGAGLELKDGNITLYAPNGATFKAGMKTMTGAEKGNHRFPNMPGSKLYAGHFHIKRQENGKPVEQQLYRVKREDGSVYFGMSNDLGHTMLVNTGRSEKLEVAVGVEEYFHRWKTSEDEVNDWLFGEDK